MIVVSVMYLVKCSNLAFEFKHMVLKCFSVSIHGWLIVWVIALGRPGRSHWLYRKYSALP